MQHADHFKSFMTDVVNINTTRLSQLDASVSALKEFLKGVKWDVSISSFFSQGSWAHGTIIKPIKDKPFDADLLMIVEPVDGWEAKQYIDELYGVFKESGVYKDKVVRYSHCVTIGTRGSGGWMSRHVYWERAALRLWWSATGEITSLNSRSRNSILSGLCSEISGPAVTG